MAGREGEWSGGPEAAGSTAGGTQHSGQRGQRAGWRASALHAPHARNQRQPCMLTTARMTCSRVGPSAAELCLQQGEAAAAAAAAARRTSVVGTGRQGPASPARCKSIGPACCPAWKGRGGVACPVGCRFRWALLLATLGGSGHGPIRRQGGSGGSPGGPGGAVHSSAPNLSLLDPAWCCRALLQRLSLPLRCWKQMYVSRNAQERQSTLRRHGSQFPEWVAM